jgi:hypothetical protein
MAGYWIIVSIAGVLLAWAIAFIVAFGVLLAVSLDGAGKLAIRAARSSTPAMWLPPAMLLVSERTPLASGLGFLVIVASVRLLVLNLAQRNVVHLRRHSSRREPFFRHVTTNDGSFSRHTAPVILGALALQSGISMTIAGYPLIASMLVAFGAALWTVTWVSRGAYRTSAATPKPLQSLLSILLTLALAVWISSAEVRLASPSLMESWRYVAYGTRPSEPEGRTSAARLVDTKKVMLAGKDLVPGVILRPETRARNQEHARLLPASARGLLISRPLTIRFTGEYHLFPTSSGQVQSDSVVYSGTPLDAAYINMGGGSMETEAYQPLRPPIDFTNCGRVELTLRNGERSPSSATLHLIHSKRMEEIGSEIFGFEPAPIEILKYDIALVPRPFLVDGIRIVFHRDPSRRSQSTKVAIEKFTLIPRQL